MIGSKTRVPMVRTQTRPRPATRLEAQIRSFWDASLALAQPDFTPGDGEMRMARPAAVQILAELATGHPSPRLRLAAADRLMSFAPETAAQLINRRAADGKVSS